MPEEIPVSDNFQPVPGVKYDDAPAEPVTEPAKVEEPVSQETIPPVEPKTEEPKEPVVPEAPKGDEPPKVDRKPKTTPFQTLLDKKHEAEVRAETAEAKLKELSEQPKGAATTADIKAFAEKYGLDEAFAADLVATTRNGIKPELPKEVQDLIAKQQLQEQVQADQEAFKADYSRLEGTLKDELLKNPEVRDKVMALAYSTEKAPDGEPYFKKPLFELYMNFVKPEVEPGKASAEPTRGGSKAGTHVMDFQDIADRDDPKELDAMDSATFTKYNTWLNEKQGRSPIRRA
jgi:hypothetical protein